MSAHNSFHLELDRPNDGGEIVKGAVGVVEALAMGKVQGAIGAHVEGLQLSQALNRLGCPPTAREGALVLHEHDLRQHVLHLGVVLIDECARDGGAVEALLHPIQERYHVLRAHVAR